MHTPNFLNSSNNLYMTLLMIWDHDNNDDHDNDDECSS